MMPLLLRYGCRLALLLLTALPLAGKAQDARAANAGEISFIENSWGEALKQAAKQQKYIFVDAYATWCGPCKMLKRTTFKNKEAAAFYNSNFINLAMDMEKGEGPALGSEWQLTAYPTLLIFNAKGKLVLYSRGFIRAPDLIRFGKMALAKGKKS